MGGAWEQDYLHSSLLFSHIAYLLMYVPQPHTQILIVITQSNPAVQSGLETALFWGIRLTVVSTAINPILYGLLARQYRMAYIYVFRLCFSKCCSCCVDPPLKDVFGEYIHILCLMNGVYPLSES